MRAWRSANDYAKLGSLILNVETRSRSRIVLLSRDGSPPPRVLAVCKNIYIYQKFVSPDLDYDISCFVKVENLQSKSKFYLETIFDIVMISSRYYRIDCTNITCSFYIYIYVLKYKYIYIISVLRSIFVIK